MREKNFNAASDYYNIHGNLDVPNPYKTDGDFDPVLDIQADEEQV